MFRRTTLLVIVIAFAMLGTGCKNKSTNPIADVDSKQPDKVLFDRAMDALKHNRFDVARITLQTMINTYPDSEFIARAKLGVCDSWLTEGGSAAWAQAELECKDFITFFPNMPEAAEAQLKVANIHYQQMEKPDRDFTHAKKAEDEYRQLILQFPDSSLVTQAKQRLRQVQEVLAEREFRIGRFYFLRESWAASIARLRSLVDAYPLYSQVDEALFTLGQSYEAQADTIRASKMDEITKAKVLSEITKNAGAAYTRIITRYPAMERVEDARKRLTALHLPVPTPTPEALALNKEEEDSRGETGKMGRVMGNFKKHPDMAQTANVGEPSMTDPKQTNAQDVVRDLFMSLGVDASGNKTVSVETVKDGKPRANEAVPRSDDATPVPDVAPPPTNDAAGATAASDDKASSSTKDKSESTSKKKKKKGIRKIIPF